MAKTATIYARVEPEIKEQAEELLGTLGLSMSDGIGLLLRQMIMAGGIDLRVRRKPLNINELTDEELAAEIEKGMKSIRDGKGIPVDEVEENLRKRYGIWDGI